MNQLRSYKNDLEKFLDEIVNKILSYGLSYPILRFRSYMQHSALIPSVADLHLKLARSLCIVEIPGSNRLHTQSTI